MEAEWPPLACNEWEKRDMSLGIITGKERFYQLDQDVLLPSKN